MRCSGCGARILGSNGARQTLASAGDAHPTFVGNVASRHDPRQAVTVDVVASHPADHDFPVGLHHDTFGDVREAEEVDAQPAVSVESEVELAVAS